MTVVTASRLSDLLRDGDPLAAARAGGVRIRTVTTMREADRAGWLIDGDLEGSLDAHRAAHAAGRPSEAVVAYGAGHRAEDVAARIDALAELARATGMLRAVCPVPAEGTAERPGSWGVDDLTTIAVCRLALPESVGVRPDWVRLGPGVCQIAVAFGASAWLVPDDDRSDLDRLAAGVGAAVGRP